MPIASSITADRMTTSGRFICPLSLSLSLYVDVDAGFTAEAALYLSKSS